MFCIAGTLFLLASAAALGWGLGRRERRYMEALRNASELLVQIRRKIDLFSTPAGELFCDIRTSDGFPVTQQSLQDLCREMENEGEILGTFLDRLGSGYREDTLRMCDDTAARLRERLEAAEKEYPARAKLYTAMPLLIAVSILVLIL